MICFVSVAQLFHGQSQPCSPNDKQSFLSSYSQPEGLWKLCSKSKSQSPIALLLGIEPAILSSDVAFTVRKYAKRQLPNFCNFWQLLIILYMNLLDKTAFMMYLVWLCFSKTIRVILCFYPLKNPCKREESLLGILSLESQTSFNCN